MAWNQGCARVQRGITGDRDMNSGSRFDEPPLALGIYAGNQEISPKCSELLTGTLAPDRRHPGFEFFCSSSR